MGDIPYEILQQGGFIGPRFRGVFFFENVFWRVVIRMRPRNYRVDKGGGVDFRRAAAQAVGVSSASR